MGLTNYRPKKRIVEPLQRKENTSMTAKQLTQLREKMKMTQAELAPRLGVSRGAVSRWGSGKRPIDSILTLALACLAERKQRRGKHAK